MIAGVDEAGRGPWAGNVVAAAVILPEGVPLPPRLGDSKTLSPALRETLFAWIMEHAAVGVGQASPEEIDTLNIRQATLTAMGRAVENLPFPSTHILVDGRDSLPLKIPSEAIIQGDKKIPAISAASIIAKVTRDRQMKHAHEQYPLYGFGKHQGYGTQLHREALEKYGPCPLHRMSFRPLKNLPLTLF